MIEYYKNQNKVGSIDANGSLAEVYDSLVKTLAPNVVFFYG